MLFGRVERPLKMGLNNNNGTIAKLTINYYDILKQFLKL